MMSFERHFKGTTLYVHRKLKCHISTSSVLCLGDSMEELEVLPLISGKTVI